MDPIALTRDLVGIDSTTGREHDVTAFLASRLEAAGWRVQLQPVRDGRANLYATREPPVVVLSTHLDTVPPYIGLREDDEWLHGRGTCDAKGIAAAMVHAAETLAASGEHRIGLLFVVGEENGSDGAKAAHALEPKGRWMINGEPTEGLLTIGQKGVLRATVTTTGRAAHSAYPEEGSSAVLPLLDALQRIRRLPMPYDPLLGTCTMNIGTVQGGVAPNVIPAAARAELLYRTVGHVPRLRQEIEAAARPSAHVEFPLEIPPVRAPALPGWATTVVSFCSDLAFYGDWGTGYQLGPGTIRVAHTDEERLAKQDLLDGAAQYVRLARELLALESA
jgi:acetylornithine deacetylase